MYFISKVIGYLKKMIIICLSNSELGTMDGGGGIKGGIRTLICCVLIDMKAVTFGH